ncbi:MAG TPA: hypothetical protein VGB37_16515 [Candidatus Lokiarchaeia archaeon]
MENTTEEIKQEDKLKLYYGLPIGICTKKEHIFAEIRARAFFKQDKIKEIESYKRELARAKEEIIRVKKAIKETRKKKFMPLSYKNSVLQVREKHQGYKIIENKDSIKIERGLKENDK